MEVEFDVKITPGALYDYMLFHTYTSASGLIGAIVGALLVVGFFMGAGVIFLIAGVVILAYLPWTLFIKSRQQYLANPAFKNPLHYKMTEEGVEVSQGEEVQSQKWGDMHKAVSTPRSLILYTSPVNASIFPKKDLGEKASGVIQIISVHMPSKKVKIRG
ncbi:YcxB family protein [Parablautia muri]|uniref:YcxB family protein n=1 Tax=Parablautia muri TaxID=2320879 RepID=A0A9X5BIX4_9FIRM|nr:YcxB family protein [Parablautia muri]NBJ94487.1 YcxB family protein [Parablautia muri]